MPPNWGVTLDKSRPAHSELWAQPLVAVSWILEREMSFENTPGASWSRPWIADDLTLGSQRFGLSEALLIFPAKE